MAFRTGANIVAVRVAIGASGMTMIEAVHPATCVRMLKLGIPIARGMTLGAGCAELSGVGSRLGVTGSAVGWSAFENIIHVAFDTSHTFMRASQWERNREPKFIVRKINRINNCQRSIRAVMIWMSGPA